MLYLYRIQTEKEMELQELELLSLRVKVKELKEVVDLLLIKDISDKEKGRLEGIKKILER